MNPQAQLATLSALFGLVGLYAGLYGAGIAKVVDACRNVFDKSGTASKWIWNVLALALGLAWAHLLQLDLNGIMLGHAPAWVLRSMVGIGIGGSSSGWHEIFDAISGFAKAKHAEATAHLAAVATPPDPAGEVTITSTESEPESGGTKTTVKARRTKST